MEPNSVFWCIKFNRPDLISSAMVSGDPFMYKELTPLQYSVSKGNYECSKLLLKYCTNINDALVYCKTIDCCRLLIEAGADINTYGILSWLIVCNNMDLVSYLIDVGADVNIPDKYGETPLYVTAYKENIPMMELLLKHGADPSIRSPKKGCGTPLRSAVRNNKFESIATLVTHGANINELCDYGCSLLHDAVYDYRYHKTSNVINFLLDHGVDPEIKDNLGHTALYYVRDQQIRDLIQSYIDLPLIKGCEQE
jgi:ankyrin repeat protein